MARDVEKYERQITAVGSMPKAQFSTAPVQVLQRQSDLMLNKATEIDQRIAENAFQQAQNTLAANVARMEREYANNPEALESALNEYKDTFFEDINDTDVADRMGIQYDRTGLLALERAKDGQQRVINDQARFNGLAAMQGINEEIRGVSDSIFSENPKVAAAAQASLQEIIDRASGTVSQVDSQGMPLFEAGQRFTMVTNAKDSALEGGVFAWFERQPDKVAALERFKKGELKLNLPDGNGGFETVDVRTALNENSLRTLEATAQRQIAEAEAAANASAANNLASVQVAVTMTDDPVQLMNLQKQVETMRPNISPSGYVSTTTAIYNKLDAQRKELQDVTAGSAFVSGTAYLNPQDDKAVKQMNTYYDKAVVPTLAQMSVPERNTYLSNLIDSTKVVPQRLAGDIATASRSRDMETVTAAADLVDRIRASNPNMLRDFKQQDIARLELVRSLRESGYDDAEAFERADKTLDPANESALKLRKAELAGAKLDYRANAVAAFTQPFYVRALPGNSGSLQETDTSKPSGAQVIQLESDYRRAYESQYQLTGNSDISKKHADSVVRGLYGVTTVNGKNQVMKYAPENFYSIPGIKNDWMREQLLDAVNEATKNSMMAPEFDPKTDVILVPDPNVTPRTAKTGQPAYKLMFIRKHDGSLGDLLGPNQYFTFEPQKKKKSMIEDARQQVQPKKVSAASPAPSEESADLPAVNYNRGK